MTTEDKIKKLQEPLSINNIDFRVQSMSAKGYVTLLAYKDARVDMQRLDDTIGVLNWKREHTRDNKNCIVSIWCDEKKQWISKEDTGTESNTEQEKGLASDSFKRACFNWGIGRELYDYPQIFFQLYPNEFKADGNKAKPTFDFKLSKWRWEMENKDGKITLKGYDDKNRLRYDSTRDFNGIPKDNAPQQEVKKETKPAPQSNEKPKMDDALYQKAVGSTILKSLKNALGHYDLTPQQTKGISDRIKELEK